MPRPRHKFVQKTKLKARIPTASMADIAFLLFVFFVSTTTFRTEKIYPKHLRFPEAAATTKVPERRRDILHLWIDPGGDVYINDVRIPVEQVAEVIHPLFLKQPRLIVAVRADRKTKFGVVNDALDGLKVAGAVRVNFATLKEREETPAG